MIRLFYRLVLAEDNGLQHIGVHAVFVDQEKIVGISKYPIGPRCNGKGMEAFLSEMKLYNEACSHAPLNYDDYHLDELVIVNGWGGIFPDEKLKQFMELWFEDK